MSVVCFSPIKWSAFLVGLIAFLIYAPIPPHTTFSEIFTLAPTKPLINKLALEEKLANAELWHKGDFIGPETFSDYKGELYTSLHTGEVIKFKKDGSIETVVRTGKPCRALFEEKICGRSMGLKFDDVGNLFVADAYYGIFKVDVNTGTKEQIISPVDQINGEKSKVFNSLALSKSGDIYWSDSSTKFGFEDVVFDMLSDPSGRLIFYNSTTKTNTVLIDKLSFANGVILSKNEDFVLVSNFGRNRIHRYYLKGPKNGTHDIFIDGLPGTPDNIQSDGQGGFLVALYMAVDDNHPSVIKILQHMPVIRKILARAMGFAKLILHIIDSIFPADFLKEGIHFIGHSKFAFFLTPKRATILRLSSDGEILDSLHNLNGHIRVLSEAYIFQDMLYLGSPFNDYVGRISLFDIGWERLRRDTF